VQAHPMRSAGPASGTPLRAAPPTAGRRGPAVGVSEFDQRASPYEQPEVVPHELQTKHDPARCISLPQL